MLRTNVMAQIRLQAVLTQRSFPYGEINGRLGLNLLRRAAAPSNCVNEKCHQRGNKIIKFPELRPRAPFPGRGAK